MSAQASMILHAVFKLAPMHVPSLTQTIGRRMEGRLLRVYLSRTEQMTYSKLTSLADGRHQYAREWKKRTGGKVVGYLCTYTPEEILYAGGILPVRILGSHKPSDLTEKYVLSTIMCPFMRDCLAQGLAGDYDYLDGIAMAQTCPHGYECFHIWRKHIPRDFSYFLYMPLSVQCSGRYEYLAGEYADFKRDLEKWLGKEITEEDLDRAIEIYNHNRTLCRKVYEFRKKDKPPVTGLDAMELVLSSQTTDKAEHSKVLEEMLAELPDKPVERQTGIRLMILGSVNDDREFMRMVENELSMPATFVIEDHCTGTRYFWNNVTPQKDRLMAIAIRYLHRPPCPAKDWPARRRLPFVEHLLKEFRAQALLIMNQKFCQPHEYDNYFLANSFSRNGLHTYSLEFDITLSAGLKTRVEALIETMGVE